MNATEAQRDWQAHVPMLQERGIFLPDVKSYLPPEFKANIQIAMDAQPTLTTTSNAGIPSWLTTLIDPDIISVLFSPLNGAKILGERRKGDWTTQTAMFPIVENTGQTSAYGDFNNNGSTSANTNFPQRQSFLFQTILQYGELEMERAGLARINWVSELQKSATIVLNNFGNLTYFKGVAGLQNYGLLNDPRLSAPIAPGPKAAGGGNVWVTSAGVLNATANEVYADIQALYGELISQSGGLVNQETKMVLALSPLSSMALTATNSFNVNVSDLIKKNFPSIRIETAVQYGVVSTTNPQGIVGGNEVQLIAETVEGQETGYCAFNEKLRAHKIINELSSFKQKYTQGSWGAIIRLPFAFAQMLGV